MNNTETTLPKITSARFDGRDVLVTVDGKTTRYVHEKLYYVDGALLRALILHKQANGRATFLLTAHPRKAHKAEMPGRGRNKFTGWEYVEAVTKNFQRCLVSDSRFWLDIDKLCFSFDLVG